MHFFLAFLHCSLSILILTIFPHNSIAQHPPKLIESPSGHLETKRIAFTGSTIHLPCLVDKSNDDLFIDWTKDGDSITNVDSRIKQTNSDSLKIRELLPEDTGFYLCKAVNGFGSVEVGINLIVLEHDVSEVNKIINDTNTKDSELRPRIVQVSPVQVGSDEVAIIQREVGSSVRFKCEASGKPKPTIHWFHNHNMIQSVREEPTAASRKGRWTLVIYDLKLEDSGNYSCFIVNPFGNATASFILDVVDRTKNKPQFSSHHPQNTTITEEGNASFQCHVKSTPGSPIPDIQWLKRVNFGFENMNREGENVQVESSSLIEVDGQWYRVLPSSHSILTRESKDIYSSRLLIENVRMDDEGEYCCVLTDGFDGIERAKKAHLTVIPKVVPIAYIPQITRSDGSFLTTESPFPIVIAGIAITFLVVVFITFVLVHCRYRKAQSSSIASSIGSNHSFTNQAPPSDHSSNSFNQSKVAGHFLPPFVPEVPIDGPIHHGQMNKRVPPNGGQWNGPPVVPPSPRRQVNQSGANMNLHINQTSFHPYSMGPAIHSSPHHGTNQNHQYRNGHHSPISVPAYSSVPIFSNGGNNELNPLPKQTTTVISSPRHQIRTSIAQAGAQSSSYQVSHSEEKGSVSSYHSNHNQSESDRFKDGGSVQESAHYDYSTISYGYVC